MGVRRATDGYVTALYVPPGAVAVDGLSATGVVRIHQEGLDYTTANTVQAAQTHAQDDAVFCLVSPVAQELMDSALTGAIASGGANWRIGRGVDENITVYAHNTDTNKPYWRYNAATNAWVYSNDGVSSTPFGTGAGVTGGDGISVTAGDIDIDVTDTVIFKQTSAGAGDSGKIPRLNSSGELDVSLTGAAENTASKTVLRKSDSNITVPTTPTSSTDASSKSYVDTSIVRPFYQEIGMNGFGAGNRAFAGATSDTDGTLYVASVTNTTTLTISRFTMDASTKMYYRSHTTTLSVTGSMGASTVVGIAVVGTYIYLHVSDNSPAGYLRRYDKADLTNVTSMTYSGTAPDTATSDHVMYSNGTDIIVKSATTTWYRYTISGTTATNAATVTFPDASAAVYDGSKVYAITSSDTIGRYATTGGSVEASTDFNIDAISDNDVYRGLALFDSTRIYFIRGVQNYDEAATVANQLHLYPFTKP